jgi:chorismate dehydratase
MPRIGYVKYLNTLPLVHGLDALSGVELVAAVPSKLAPMLAAGEVDVALASVVDAHRQAEPLTLLPCGMIGCDGPTLTVRLFSGVPIDRVHTVHADTDSHTSVALLQVLLHGLHGTRPRIVPFDARERIALGSDTASPADQPWPESLLVIGDKVVTDSPPAVRYPHQLDLGEAWKAMTGLPFVYAVWMCREKDAHSPTIRATTELLDRQRRRNRQRADWIVATHAPQRRWPEDLARRYLGELLRYEVGPRERLAVARFTTLAAGLGLLPDRAPRWADEAAAPAHAS